MHFMFILFLIFHICFFHSRIHSTYRSWTSSSPKLSGVFINSRPY